jgi:acyl-phosphate glycerol 3-phosphate acyltransferase
VEGKADQRERQARSVIAVYALMGFLSGSLMFSYWLGLLARVDIRDVGDGNPGGFNLWQAAGYKLGLLGIFLEFMKGYLPLLFLIEGGYVGGWGIVPVAVAPILGHAFSPFVGFKGGKAIAVSFGIWSAVTRFEGAIALAAILAFLSAAVKLGLRGKPVTSDMDGCQAVAGMLMLGGYLTLRAFPGYVILLCMCNLLVFAYTNRWKLYRSARGLYEGYKQRSA